MYVYYIRIRRLIFLFSKYYKTYLLSDKLNILIYCIGIYFVKIIQIETINENLLIVDV